MGERRIGVGAFDIRLPKRVTIFPTGGGEAITTQVFYEGEDPNDAIKTAANEANLDGDYVAVVSTVLSIPSETIEFSAAPAKPPVEVVF